MKKASGLFLILAVFILLSHTAAFADRQITSLDQLNSAKITIGVDQGSAAEIAVRDQFSSANIAYYLDKIMGLEAVSQKKIDAFACDRLQLELSIKNGMKGIRLLSDSLGEPVSVAVGISPVSKIRDLEGKLNRFISEIRSDGTLDDMLTRWLTDEDAVVPAIPLPDHASLHLTVGTSGIVQPYSYYRGSELTGFDIELGRRFAAWLGADLQFKVYDYGAIVAAAVTGDVDCIMANLNVTEERKEAITFSDVLYISSVGIVVQDDTGIGAEDSESSTHATVWNSVKTSFEKTFLREDRWQLFLVGIGNTLLISVFSILLGTILGFLLFLLCRKGGRLSNKITDVCLWLVQGMPTVVLLMVLYYIVFGKLSISGIAVSVIGFTMTFGASVFGLVKTGVGAIDSGQYEAAYALGYSDWKTLYRFILPQALPLVMSSYQKELIGLLKATAVVGYIAVQDLTKMGDIVRSRTYEAFFPLIAVTLIYFCLESLLSLLSRTIENAMNPRLRKPEEILKGVENDD